MAELQQSAIKTIEYLAQQTPNCISLSQGAMKVIAISPDIKEFLRDILLSDKSDYYQSRELTEMVKESIANDLARRYGTSVAHDNIMITHGSMGAMSTLFLTLLNPDDEVIIPEPAYPLYNTLTRIAHAKPVFVSCKNPDFDWARHTPHTMQLNTSKPWVMPLDAIRAATTKRTKIIVFSNPMNPTGLVVDPSTLKELAAWCNTHGIYLLVDEVYEDYLFSGAYTSIASLLHESPWVIRTSSLSKNFALSGWRTGHALLPAHLAYRADIVQHAMLVCPSTLGQWAAVYAHQHPEITQELVNITISNLAMVLRMLEPLKAAGLFNYVAPDGSFFLFAQASHHDTRQLCSELIERAGIALVPGESFGPSGAGFVRICFARNPAVLKEGLERICTFYGYTEHD